MFPISQSQPTEQPDTKQNIGCHRLAKHDKPAIHTMLGKSYIGDLKLSLETNPLASSTATNLNTIDR